VSSPPSAPARKARARVREAVSATLRHWLVDLRRRPEAQPVVFACTNLDVFVRPVISMCRFPADVRAGRSVKNGRTRETAMHVQHERLRMRVKPNEVAGIVIPELDK
jgi:hypothetical protein